MANKNNFRFCKAKYIIKPSGKVIEKGSAKSLYRCARKIKKLEQLIKGGTASYEDLRSVVVSGMGYYGRYNDHAKTLKIARMFYSIYGFNCNDLATYRRLDNEIHMRETI